MLIGESLKLNLGPFAYPKLIAADASGKNSPDELWRMMAKCKKAYREEVWIKKVINMLIAENFRYSTGFLFLLFRWSLRINGHSKVKQTLSSY